MNMLTQRSLIRWSLVAALTAAAPVAQALEFLSLAEPALMFDAPSRQAKPLFIVARHTPVELVVSLEGWIKVRDREGTIAWVEKRSLTPKKMLIATTRAEVRQQPDAAAAQVFETEKDVVLEFVEAAPAGWVKVRHQDGQSGFVRVNQVWGL